MTARLAHFCRTTTQSVSMSALQDRKMAGRTSFGKRFLGSVLCLLALVCGPAAAQLTVDNVRAVQRAGTKLVDIDYDVTGTSGPVVVGVQGSPHNGNIWTLPLTTLSGAIGNNVTPGANLRITWDAGADWNRQFSTQTLLLITVSEQPPADMALVIGGYFPTSLPRYSGQNVPTYSIAKTETTWEQWLSVKTWAATHGYDIGATGVGVGNTFPVTNVSWYECLKWCNARSEQEALTPVYTTGAAVYRTGNTVPGANTDANGYRLPSDKEWAFAARGGVTPYRFSPYSGGVDIDAVAWFTGNAGGATHAVGTKVSNELGVFDMSGNVWEWCFDYESVGPNRLKRGGSWNSDAAYCEITSQYSDLPTVKSNVNGLRVVRSSGASASTAGSGLLTIDTGGIYQIISGSFTWQQAKADAEARGGRLAVLNTWAKVDASNAYVEGLFGRQGWPELWIGLTDWAVEGQWKWINGEINIPHPPDASSGWNDTQPNGSADSDVDYAFLRMSGWFADKSWQSFSYLLERSSTLEVTPSQNGTVTGAGEYPPGATATLTATPSPGYLFGGWTGDASGTTNPLSVSMDSDKLIGASFQTLPTISDIADQITNRGVSTGAINFTVSAAGTDPATLTVTGTSSNQAFVPNANIVFGGSGANRTVTVTPKAFLNGGQSGVATITITVSNGGVITNDTFTLAALAPTGMVAAWGRSDEGQTNIPSDLSGAIAITAGCYHTVVLKNDGTVAAWGAGMTNSGVYPEFGQSIIPAGLSGVTAIAPGHLHTAALKGDGTVVAWGYNNYGQTNVPVGLSGVVAISTGAWDTVALKSDGTVVAWGLNSSGQTTIPPGLNGVMAIAAGNGHTVALKNDGTVVAWGDNVQGQATVPVGLSGVTAIAAGEVHTVALKSDGTVVAWGYNGYGETTVPAGLSGVTAIAAGYIHSLALRSDGTVVAWGYNGDGETTVPVGLSGVTAIAGGAYHTVAITSLNRPTISDIADQSTNRGVSTGAIPFTVGDVGTAVASLIVSASSSNQAAVPNSNIVFGGSGANRTVTVTPKAFLNGGQSGVATITITVSDGVLTSSDSFVLAAIAPAGNVVAWGNNYAGKTTVPVGLIGVTAIAAGGNHTVALKSDGTVVTWGDNGNGQTTIPAGLSGVVAIAAGDNHTVALKSDGTVVAWGDNGNGQTTIPAGLSGVVAIAAAGYAHTVALKSNGTVVAWGKVFNGSAFVDDIVPAGLGGVVAIAAGDAHTVALKSNGTVVAWGKVFNGSAFVDDIVPAGLNGVTAISAGMLHSVALKSEGTIVAWGLNNEGQTTIPAGLTGVVAIAASYTQTVALKSNGTVVAWGNNSAGQTTIPTGLSGATAIAAGSMHTVALTSLARPIMSPIADQSTNRGVSTGPISFSIGDGDTSPESLTITGKSNNQALVPDADIVFGGSGENRTVVVTPKAFLNGGQSGVAAITITVSDGLLIKSNSFTLTALATTGTVVAWGRSEEGQTNIPAGLSEVTAIAGGNYHTVILKNDGTVTAWGRNDFGQTNVPAGLSGVTAIAGGGYHTVALKGDGTVVAWGNNADGQTSVPANLSGVTAIAAGAYHTVALRSNGTVVAWGRNTEGQVTVANPLNGVVTAIAAGAYHTVALKTDGTVVAWGWNDMGQTNVPAGLSGVTAIAAGYLHTMTLKNDGAVVAWGGSGYGTTPVPEGLSGVIAVAAGYGHAVALKSDGTLVAWGRNSETQTTIPTGLSGVTAIAAGSLHTVALTSLARPTMSPIADQSANRGISTDPILFTIGDGDTALDSLTITGKSNNQALVPDANIVFGGSGVNRTVTVTPTAMRNGGQSSIATITITVSDGFMTTWDSFVLKAAGPVGNVAAWGSNGVGQTEVPVNLGEVTAIACGENHTVALRNDGTVVAWGYNQFGQTDVPGSLNGVTAIAGGGLHTVALKSDGTVVAWGRNLEGQTNVPAGLTGVIAIAAGTMHTVVLKGDGTVVVWGQNTYGQSNVPAGLTGVVAIAAGGVNTVAVKSDGTVVAWGYNGNGQAAVPVGLTGVIAISVGSNHTLALKNSGTVVGWGFNDFGQATIPAGLNGVTAITGAAAHSVALKNDGTVVAWGSNAAGQTGVPSGLSGVRAIAAGNNHTVALTSLARPTMSHIADQSTNRGISTGPISFTIGDGDTALDSLTITGKSNNQALVPDANIVFGGSGANRTVTVTPNSFLNGGQSGIATITITVSDGVQTSSPTFVLSSVAPQGTVVAWGSNQYGQLIIPAGLSGVTAIVAGGDHAVALKSDGTLVAWGNGYGQWSIPVGLIEVTAIAAGFGHTVALKSDGTVVAWGRNLEGQTAIPSGLRGVTAIAAGYVHTVALTSDGAVVAWGSNQFGQTTVPDAGFSGVTAIVAGDYHTVALKSDGTVVAWGRNDWGQTNVPAGLSGVKAIAAGAAHTVALKSDGTVVAWGSFFWHNQSNRDIIVPAGLSGVTAIAAGQSNTVALKSDGTVAAWGDDGLAQTGVPALSGVTAIAASGYYTLVITNADPPTISDIPDQISNRGVSSEAVPFTVGDVGTPVASLIVTGSSNNQALVPDANIVFGGSGANRTVTVTPKAFLNGGQSGVATITVTVSDGVLTSSDTFELTSIAPAGTVVSWGWNDNGQTIIPSGLSGVSAIAAGYAHTVALKSDGTVVAWGAGTTNSGGVPVWGQSIVPEGLSGVTAIAAGLGHTVALKGNGTVVAWGRNDSGQTTIPAGLSGVTAIAAGGLHTVALKGNGTVGAWGYDMHGQSTIPAGLSGVTAIAAGLSHTVALRNDGAVVAWGKIYNGSAYVDVVVPDGLSGVMAIAAGYYHTVALKSDGTVVAWGRNDNGQTSIPAGLSGVTAIAAGGEHTVALKSDGTVVAWGKILDGSAAYVDVVVPAALSGVTTIAGGGFHTVSIVIPPTISDIPDTNTNEDTVTGAIPFTVGNGASSSDALMLGGTSSNPTLVPNANIVFGGSGANRTVTVTPAANQSGTATITVTASNGVLTTETFVLTVNPINDAPTITDIVDRTIGEDANTGAIAFTVGDVDNPVAGVTLNGSSSNAALVPNGNIVFGGSGASRTVTVTPVANRFGTATITVTASDGSLSAQDTFLLTVNPINDPPTITNILDRTIDEDTNTGAVAFTVGDVDNPLLGLTITGTSSNPSLVPNENIVFSGIGASLVVTATPLPNQSGTATITVTVSDGALAGIDTFVLTVNPVNDVPTLTDVADRSIDEDTNTGAVVFTIGDPETAAGSLVVTRASSNLTLVPLANVVLGGTGASRTVTVTPVFNLSGSSTITLTVSDGTVTTTDTFLLTVNAVNDAPTIANISDRTINEDTNTGAIGFGVNDVDNPLIGLTATGSSSNPALVPDENVVIRRIGVALSVTVTPLPNQSGTATITVTVSDGLLTASDTFLLTVTAVNDPPTLTNIADRTIDEDTNTGAIAFTIGDVETAAGSLTVGATSSNTALVPNTNIVLGGSGSARTVAVTPLPNQNGQATITVTVSDGTATTNSAFLLTVDPVNDAPTIEDIADQIINENTSTGGIALSIGDLETAAGSLTVTGTSSNPGLVPNANIVLGGSGAARTVTVTPTANQFGTTTITLTVSDGQLSATDTFVVTINHAPTITAIADQVIDFNTTTSALSFTIGDFETPAEQLTLSVGSSNGTLVPVANIVLGGSSAARTVTVTPASGEFGTATISVFVSDGLLTTSVSFLLTVNAPEIVVEGPGGVELIDGTSVTSFGSVNLGRKSSPVTYTIRNTGTTNLTGLALSMGSGDVADYQIGSLGATTLAVGASTTFTVTFLPVAAGYRRADLHLSSNDVNEGDFVIGLGGTAVEAYVWLNFAGSPGLTGSTNGVGAAARFSYPNAVAVDAAGNSYVTDSNNHTIRKITAAGTVSTLAGLAGTAGSTDGTGTAARFNNPSGLAVDVAGNVYVSDTNNHTIRKITAAGVVTTFAGVAGSPGNNDGPGTGAQFKYPHGLAVDTNNNVYVADTNNHLIRKINSARVVSTLAGTAGTHGSTDATGISAQFYFPNAVAVDALFNVYVADQFNHTIRKITSAGLTITLAGLAETSGSLDLTGSEARFNNPSGIAIDGSGNLYVTDTVNETIRKMTPAGNVTTLGSVAGLTGSVNGRGMNARFNAPYGIASTSTGLLYVADSNNNRITQGTAAPEIVVEQPVDTDLVDAAATITCPSITLTHSTAPVHFVIRNVGVKPLTGLAISKDGTHAANFALSSLPKTTLAAGESMTVSVTFTPTGLGARTAAIHIASNDADENAFDIALAGTGLNNAPTISDVADRATNEDTATGAIAFTVGDIETAAGSLTVTRASSNLALVPLANVVLGGTGASRTVTITPVANLSGSSTITLTVSDGTVTTSDTFLLTVNPVNDPPTISNVANRTINEDANTGAVAITIGDLETPTASLTMSGTSDNQTLVPNANIVFGGSGASRTVTVTPASNQAGTATITLTVSDGAGSASDTFLLTVTAVNDAPTITNIADRSIDEDTTTGAVAFSIGDPETAATALVVTRASSNLTLVPLANVVLGGTGTSRTVTVTPVANLSGTATITVTVSDGVLTASDTFLLTVTVVNDTPTVTDITNRTINEDTNTGAVAFTIGDVDSPLASLTVSGSSSDTTLVPNANIVFGGTGASRTVTVTPAPNQNGSATITISVSDGTTIGTDTFLLTVTGVNDAPTISDITSQSINEDANTGALNFTIGDLETAPALLVLTGSSSNLALVPNENIVFGGTGSARTVTVTPAANQSGTSTITVTASDGLLTVNDTFVLTVLAINDSPTITDISNQIINLNANTGALTFTIGDVETAPATLTMSGSSSNTTLVPNTAIVFGGSGANRTVTVTPAANQKGTTTITVQTSDGTNTASDTFVLYVGLTPLQLWRLTNFGSPDNTGPGADLNDFEKDGVVNLIEYALGLNPKQNSAGFLPQAQRIGGNLVMNVTQPAGVSGITYGAEWSPTMAAGTWLPVADTGTGNQHTFSVPMGTNKRIFMRFKVSIP